MPLDIDLTIEASPPVNPSVLHIVTALCANAITVTLNQDDPEIIVQAQLLNAGALAAMAEFSQDDQDDVAVMLASLVSSLILAGPGPEHLIPEQKFIHLMIEVYEEFGIEHDFGDLV